MNRKFAKMMLALTLSASSTIASATLYNISAVLDGSDDDFKFSGIHFAGDDGTGTGVNGDNNPMTGTQITRFLADPVSGTYDDVTGALDMVLSLDPDSFNTGGITASSVGFIVPGTVAFSGNMFFDSLDNTLNPASALTTIFSDEGIDDDMLLMNTTMSFAAGFVDCCVNATQRPNSFDGVTMSLWGADFASPGEGLIGPDVATLGLDLRLSLTAVPVPAAVWLFGSGLLGLIAAARRKSA